MCGFEGGRGAAIDDVRTPSYPVGFHAANQGACCAACVDDEACIATVWNSSPEFAPANEAKCWPLSYFKTIEDRGDRAIITKLPVQSITLASDEFVTSVSGQHSPIWLSSLRFTTNKNQSIGTDRSRIHNYNDLSIFDFNWSDLGVGRVTAFLGPARPAVGGAKPRLGKRRRIHRF